LPLRSIQPHHKLVQSLVVHDVDEVDFLEKLAAGDSELVEALAVATVPGASHAVPLEAATAGGDEPDENGATVVEFKGDSALKLGCQVFAPVFLCALRRALVPVIIILLVESLVVEGGHSLGIVGERLVAAHKELAQAHQSDRLD